MVKNKNARITITLECVDCAETVGRRIGKNRITHRYVTQKNRHNTPGRLEVRKFCPYCRTHRIYREILKK